MLTQIGRILYWLGSILAVVILLSDLLVACDEDPHAPYSGYILIGYAIIVCSSDGSAATCFLGPPRIRSKATSDMRYQYPVA